MVRIAVLTVCVCLALSHGTALADTKKLGRYEFILKEIATDQELDNEVLTNGKPLVIHIWAPDCPHCKRHMPYVAALYKKIDVEVVNFVSCSMSNSKSETEKFIHDKKLEFPVLLESSGKIGDGFSEEGWPTTFVFAPGGEFVGWCDTNGPAYLTEVLELVEQANEMAGKP